MAEITHIRKFNYINWMKDLSKFGLILFIILVVNALAMTTYIQNDNYIKLLGGISAWFYCMFYISKLIIHTDQFYWTYIEVK